MMPSILLNFLWTNDTQVLPKAISSSAAVSQGIQFCFSGGGWGGGGRRGGGRCGGRDAAFFSQVFQTNTKILPFMRLNMTYFKEAFYGIRLI